MGLLERNAAKSNVGAAKRPEEVRLTSGEIEDVASLNDLCARAERALGHSRMVRAISRAILGQFSDSTMNVPTNSTLPEQPMDVPADGTMPRSSDRRRRVSAVPKRTIA